MVLTRSGLSTSSLTNLDMLSTISIMTELYHDETIVSALYDKFIIMSPSDKLKYIKDLNYQYNMLQTAKTVF